jgi:hypothetical protein
MIPFKTFSMDNHIWSKAGGLLVGMTVIILKLDWSHVLADINVVALLSTVLIYLFKIAFGGLIGGAFGKLGGVIVEKLMKKKARKPHK